MNPPFTSPQAASLYHAHHSREANDLEFWQQLADEHGGRVLELGCGTGRVLAALAAHKHPVIGLDYDAGMLGWLRSQFPGAQYPQIQIVQANAAAIPLKAQFGLILMPCNTYSTLQPAERQALLRQSAAYLQPGGVFAASLPNPNLLASLPRQGLPEVEDVFPHPADGEPVQVSSAWQRTASGVTFSWYYDHLQPDGRVLRTALQTHHYFASLEVYRQEIAAAGLHLEALYGDFGRLPHQPDSPNLIWCARRPAG